MSKCKNICHDAAPASGTDDQRPVLRGRVRTACLTIGFMLTVGAISALAAADDGQRQLQASHGVSRFDSRSGVDLSNIETNNKIGIGSAGERITLECRRRLAEWNKDQDTLEASIADGNVCVAVRKNVLQSMRLIELMIDCPQFDPIGKHASRVKAILEAEQTLEAEACFNGAGVPTS